MSALRTRLLIFSIFFMSAIASCSGCEWRKNASTEVENPILAIGKAHEPVSIPDPPYDWIILKTSHYTELAEK